MIYTTNKDIHMDALEFHLELTGNNENSFAT